MFMGVAKFFGMGLYLREWFSFCRWNKKGIVIFLLVDASLIKAFSYNLF
jgi:hypothetical protein